MEQITRSKKYQNGVRVFWTGAGTDRDDFFPYEELVEQRINALDLLNNPRLYLINEAGHQIESAAAGCSFASKTCEDGIVITRLFDAPRDAAWRVWTDPGLVMQWWGPKGYTSPSCRIDLRAGGSYLYCMRSPEGRDFWSTGRFREVKEPERIVCTDSFADEKGSIVPAAYYGMTADFPLEMLLTVTFGMQAGRTLLTIRHTGLPAGEMRDQTRAGWNESLDKYAGVLARETYRERRSVPVAESGGKS